MKVLVTALEIIYSWHCITAPTVEQVTTVPTEGGTITITGSNFGNNSAVVIATVNSLDCSNIVILTDSVSLECTISSGTGKDHSVMITTAGQDSPSVNEFSYLGTC